MDTKDINLKVIISLLIYILLVGAILAISVYILITTTPLWFVTLWTIVADVCFVLIMTLKLLRNLKKAKAPDVQPPLPHEPQ